MVKVILIVLSVAVSPAFANQSSPPPAKSSQFGVHRPPQSDPYKDLFTRQARRTQDALEARLAESRPKVVCGMTMVPANPALDPKMAVPRPADGVDYKIRTIDPPICNPAR